MNYFLKIFLGTTFFLFVIKNAEGTIIVELYNEKKGSKNYVDPFSNKDCLNKIETPDLNLLKSISINDEYLELFFTGIAELSVLTEKGENDLEERPWLVNSPLYIRVKKRDVYIGKIIYFSMENNSSSFDLIDSNDFDKLYEKKRITYDSPSFFLILKKFIIEKATQPLDPPTPRTPSTAT